MRANYEDRSKGIGITFQPLNNFFRYLLLGEQQELRNRYLHVRAAEIMKEVGDKYRFKEQNLHFELHFGGTRTTPSHFGKPKDDLMSVITYVCENGDITKEIVVNEAPFDQQLPLFSEQMLPLAKYIDNIHNAIIPA